MTEPRRFYLDHNTDVTGASGTGRVADGVVWPDGTVTIRWRGEHQSTVNWDNIESAERVHGHGGATRIVFLDLDLDEDEHIAELQQLRAEVSLLRAGEDLDPLQEGAVPTPGQWIARWNQAGLAERLAGVRQIQADEAEAFACRWGNHKTLHEELIALAQRAGTAEAKLLHAADLLRRLPQSCPHHGTDLGASGMHKGRPNCESCRQPYRVTKVLAAIEVTE